MGAKKTESSRSFSKRTRRETACLLHQWHEDESFCCLSSMCGMWMDREHHQAALPAFAAWTQGIVGVIMLVGGESITSPWIGLWKSFLAVCTQLVANASSCWLRTVPLQLGCTVSRHQIAHQEFNIAVLIFTALPDHIRISAEQQGQDLVEKTDSREKIYETQIATKSSEE